LNKKDLMNKLSAARAFLLLKAPFYGTLLMNLKFALASCGTACTDMRRIIWDPEFLNRLSLEEIEFVMIHEVMHCVLNHINRGKGKIAKLYNVAADIVVNSMILHTYTMDEFTVDGQPVMHLAPDGVEGKEYSADQVYEMLYKKYESLLHDADRFIREIEADYGVEIDDHNIWESLPLAPELFDEWKSNVRQAVEKSSSKNSIPSFFRELLDRDDYTPMMNWRYVLNDFIRLVADHYDFSFTPADRRYSSGDVILPSFHEVEGEAVENLWILMDCSGSVDDDTVWVVLQEIKSAMEQFSSICAKLSHFDTKVSEPKEVRKKEDLKGIKIKGGGGTSFHCIFDYLKEFMLENLPEGIIIMTDGYAPYPREEASLGIPVLWILIDNDKDAPWGKSLHIQLEQNNK